MSPADKQTVAELELVNRLKQAAAVAAKSSHEIPKLPDLSVTSAKPGVETFNASSTAVSSGTNIASAKLRRRMVIEESDVGLAPIISALSPESSDCKSLPFAAVVPSLADVVPSVAAASGKSQRMRIVEVDGPKDLVVVVPRNALEFERALQSARRKSPEQLAALLEVLV